MWSWETMELRGNYFALYGACQATTITGVGTLLACNWFPCGVVVWLLVAAQVVLTVFWRRSARKYRAAMQAELATVRAECASYAAVLKARMEEPE